MIELQEVTKVYGRGANAVTALDKLTISFEEGMFTAVVGKSGSGKSTLMHLIGALDKPTAGKIIVDGEEITKCKENALAEYRNANIGFIFQSFYLEPTFSVLSNIEMPLQIAGVKAKECEERARRALQRMGIEDKANSPARDLSGGQKQRVSIARAIVGDPKIILADEPTGNLDQENGSGVIKLLRELADGGRTVILVTHNLEDSKLADIVIELNDGKLKGITYNVDLNDRRERIKSINSMLTVDQVD